MSHPKVIVDPSFRSMAEIFEPETLERLHSIADLAWARDEPMPSEQFLAEIAEADAVVFGEWRHGPAGLDAAGSRLRALLEVAGGHEHQGLDYDAALERGIFVGSCAPAFGPVVAEMGLAMALATTRGVVAADRDMRTRSERWLHEGNADNGTLFGSTAGFVGCGSISRHLQSLLEPFGVHILGYDPPIPRSLLEERGIEPCELAPMFARADVVFVLAAPTPSNRSLIDAKLMAELSVGQSLVLLSRASLVDFEAMVELSNDHGFRIATDVYPSEPVSAAHPVRKSTNSVLVPHLAGALPHALHAIGKSVVDDLEIILAGGQPSSMQYLDPGNVDAIRQTTAP